MKKVISRLIIILFLAALTFLGYYGYRGYVMYQDTMEEKSLTVRVEELRSKDNYVKLEQISSIYQELVIESEDKRFYQHGPVDYIGLARAMVTNVVTMSFKEGGSTITQQLAKNLCLSFEKSLDRKIAEVFIAQKLEDDYTKDEILEMYLNCIYFGENCYGIKEAANHYYGAVPDNMSKAQADSLVITIKCPNLYNPNEREAA